MNSVVTEARRLENLDALDRDRLDRHAAVERAARARGAVADVVDYLHAFDDLAENGVAPASRPRIQVDVVGQVDVELTRSRMRLVGARKTDRAAQVAQAVARFVDDAGRRRLLLKIRRVAAGLRHEACDDAVEDRAVIETRGDIAEKRFDRERRAAAIELDHEAAGGREDSHARSADRRSRRLGLLCGARERRQTQAQQYGRKPHPHRHRPRIGGLRS
jgi:hypothetical protein